MYKKTDERKEKVGVSPLVDPLVKIKFKEESWIFLFSEQAQIKNYNQYISIYLPDLRNS